MCGIAGFFNFPSTMDSKQSKALLIQMLDIIKHRGPDDQGRMFDTWYGLGHVRLSIMDVSDAGHQPMWSADKRYAVVYNGELYNFKALRKELQSAGYDFRSDSDTEVALYAFAEWGVEAFSKFEGMFAAVFVDTKTREAFVVRDQMGIKPLYYAQDGQSLFFASEVKALAPAVQSLSLNREAVFEQFHFRFVSGERTLYQNIKRLLPGSYLHIRAGQDIRLNTYYRVTDSLQDNACETFDLDEVESLINNSIQVHTMSDVGYAVQLSGGIDSSYITTLLSQQKQSLDTYSIALPGDKNDETSYQKQVVQKCGTQHHSYDCNGREFAQLLPEVIYHLDFPVVHAGSVFLYMLCKKISEKHKVVLTGEGADELFLGYSRYDLPLSNSLAFTLKSLGLKADYLPNLPKIRGLKSLMTREMGLDAGSFNSDLSGDILSIDGDIPYRRDMAERYRTLLGRMIASDQTSYLGSLLERQDKISMAHGVEVRVPFCNHRLFDAINPIRHSLKNKPVSKAILKKLLAQWYPDDFVYRHKNGFSIPLDDWFRDPKILGQYLDLFGDQTFKTRDFYNHQTIQTMRDRHHAGTHHYGKELFDLVSFEIWLRQDHNSKGGAS